MKDNTEVSHMYDDFNDDVSDGDVPIPYNKEGPRSHLSTKSNHLSVVAEESLNQFSPVSRRILPSLSKADKDQLNASGNARLSSHDSAIGTSLDTECRKSNVSQDTVSTPKKKRSTTNLRSSLTSEPKKYFTSTPIDNRSLASLYLPCSTIRDETFAPDTSISSTCIKEGIRNLWNFSKKDYSHRVKKQSFIKHANESSDSVKNLRPIESVSTVLQRIRSKTEAKPLNYSTTCDDTVITASPKKYLPSLSKISTHPIAIKPARFTCFGFIPIEEEIREVVTLVNLAGVVITIQPQISDSCVFSLESSAEIRLKPNETFQFYINFCPIAKTGYTSFVKFKVLETNTSYRHKLLGFGGAPVIQMIQARGLQFSYATGQYRYPLSNHSKFSFGLENIGDRTAFAHIVAVDDRNDEIRDVEITPDKLTLTSSDDPNSQQVITVKMLRKLPSITIKVYTGAERLRYMAQRYSETVNKHDNYNGLNLTSNHYPMEGTPPPIDSQYLTSQMADLLKTQTKVLILNVYEADKAKLSRSSLSRPFSSASNQDLQPGFYVPGNYTSNASMTQINCDETIIRRI